MSISTTITGQHQFSHTSIEQVWAQINDVHTLPEVWASCRHVTTLSLSDGHGVRLHIRPTPVIWSEMAFDLDITFTQSARPHKLAISFEGTDATSKEKVLSGRGQVELIQSAAEENIHITYRFTAENSGSLISLGRPMLETYARAWIREILTGFDRRLGSTPVVEFSPPKNKNGRVWIIASGLASFVVGTVAILIWRNKRSQSE